MLANVPLFTDNGAGIDKVNVLAQDLNNTINGINSEKAFRAMGNGMQVTVQGFNSANIRAAAYRFPSTSAVPFRRCRVVIPVAYSKVNGNLIYDQLYQGAQAQLAFQVGLEIGYAPSLTGIAPRKPFLFNGLNFAQYNYAGYNGPGYLVSDVLDLGQYVNKVGIHINVEGPAQAANMIPYTINYTNYINRYVGAVTSNTASQIAALGGASDVALNATAYTSPGTSQSGYSGLFTPAFLLIEQDAKTPSILGIGDSICYGTGEGYPAGTLAGDAMGSGLSNMGYLARWINETLGLNFTNFGRGSDQFFSLSNTTAAIGANWIYRAALLQLANPTHLVSQNIHNDVSGVTQPPAWAAGTFGAGAPVTNGGRYYVTTNGGNSSVAPTYSSGTNTGADGVTWLYVGNVYATASLAALALSFYTQVRSLMGANFPIIQTCLTPDASSSNNYIGAFGSDQTASTGWGNSASVRGVYNDTYVRGLPSIMGLAGFIDPNPVLETGYLEGVATTEVSKWISNGTTSHFATQDGTHPDSNATALVAATGPYCANAYGIQVQNPFGGNTNVNSGNLIPAPAQAIRVVNAASVTVLTSDGTVGCAYTPTGSVAVAMPANPYMGERHTIKDSGGAAATNNITITGTAGNIDGAATLVISANYGKVTLQWDGTIWETVA